MVTTQICANIRSSSATTADTSVVWRIWVDNAFLGSTDTAINIVDSDNYCSDVWPLWTDSATSYLEQTKTGTLRIHGCTVWQNWIESSPNIITSSKTILSGNVRAVRAEPTPEQLEAERQRNLRYEEERKEAQRKKQLAEERAEFLLMENLDPTQKDEYKKFGFFHLYVGKKKYRIEKGIAGNIKLVDEKGEAERYCIHIPSNLPVHDNLLAQKLMLETDPDRFFKTANKTLLRQATM